ncbi:MAG: hypothetical protein U1E17_04280 [Geminicoccaceae bacterium]
MSRITAGRRWPQPVLAWQRSRLQLGQVQGTAGNPLPPDRSREHQRRAGMGDAKPYTFTDAKGEFSGFDIELFRTSRA